MAATDDLLPLVADPIETMSVEHKGWLNLSDTPDRARLAKAVIALSNHGGGTVVVGMQEAAKADGGELKSQPRPSHIDKYSNDMINAAVGKFADPPVHCEVRHVPHPVTGVEHAVISVPGGSTPIISKRTCEGVIQQGRVYVRKPGPKSEEATTVAEWRALLDRCVQAGRADMLDAIRNILNGAVTMNAPLTEDPLKDFVVTARDRLMSFFATMPADAPPRMPLGRYEFAFKLIGDFSPIPLPELRTMIDRAHAIKLTGWPAFLEINRAPYTPSPVGNGIEAWLGSPDTELKAFDDAAHSDFWRIQADGSFYMVRGYQEDGQPKKAKPGTLFDITLPVWRFAEALLYVHRVAVQIDGVKEVYIEAHYSGLAGRRLTSWDGSRGIGDYYTSTDDEIKLSAKVALEAIQDNLEEIVYQLLRPLYERFSFFDLPKELVVRELEKLKANRF